MRRRSQIRSEQGEATHIIQNKKKCSILIRMVIVVFVINQRGSVASRGKVSLQATIGGRIKISYDGLVHEQRLKISEDKHTSTAKVAESYWEEDESMGSGEHNQRQPDPEVVDLKNLAPGECENANSQ